MHEVMSEVGWSGVHGDWCPGCVDWCKVVKLSINDWLSLSQMCQLY